MRGGDFLKSAFRAIGVTVVIAAAFKRNTDAVQSRLVSPILNYSHFLNSPCINQSRLVSPILNYSHFLNSPCINQGFSLIFPLF